MRGGARSPQLAPRSDAWSSYRTARGVPQEQHEALCAITCKRCEVPRRQLLPLAAASRELYIAALLPELRVLARAQLWCQLAARVEPASPSFLAWATRSVHALG